MLSSVADKMRATYRQQDYLGRIGGDEFAVYFTFRDKTDIKDRHAIIRSRAEDLCAMVEKIGDEIMQDVKISCSVGIAMAPEHGTSYETLYKSADQALYQAKEAGKNQYRILR